MGGKKTMCGKSSESEICVGHMRTRPEKETLRDIVPEGVNPISYSISEELRIFLRKVEWKDTVQLDNAITEFKDALEHALSKTVDLITKDINAIAYQDIKKEYEQKLNSANSILEQVTKERDDLQARNKRLHESTARQEKVISELRSKLNQKKQEVVAGDYVNHLEEEIAFLRGMVAAVYKKIIILYIFIYTDRYLEER
jgi:predicted  nucleic acid-binding Zn-ribbon protein